MSSINVIPLNEITLFWVNFYLARNEFQRGQKSFFIEKCTISVKKTIIQFFKLFANKRKVQCDHMTLIFYKGFYYFCCIIEKCFFIVKKCSWPRPLEQNQTKFFVTFTNHGIFYCFFVILQCYQEKYLKRWQLCLKKLFLEINIIIEVRWKK